MERLRCPICREPNLHEGKPGRVYGKIVCENEYYKHYVAGVTGYIVRTPLTQVQEELSLNPKLVTN